MNEQRRGRVEGKMTLITGAARGIGAGCATVFAQEGARLLLVDTDEESLQALADRLRATGAEVYPQIADVSVEADVQRMVHRAESIAGKLDVLVSNAAILPQHSILDTTMEEWDAVSRINMRGSFMVMKHSIASIRRTGGGAIVIISSVSSLAGQPSQGAYGPSKAYVHNMTYQLAVEYGPDHIRVNAVCPGTIMTSAVERIMAEQPDPQAWLESLKVNYPIGRLGQPEDVGYAVLFLASDEASFITGSYIVVDGGYTAH
jgi:NAD(P)-dependent dehydrogenase (short-subunit alcohol dehydrogenase family)